jgi:DNA-3-methyladenine glycosylase I
VEQYCQVGADGRNRCWWPGDDEAYQAYHDSEWGRPVTNDVRLFEKLSLEGFQAGLSWLTILRKRENFRQAFAGFEIESVADFGEEHVLRLLDDAGIVRHRGKITAAINNAQRALELIDEFGSLAAYVWSYEPVDRGEGIGPDDELVSVTPESTALSKDLKQRGWRFVGPTTVYAFMEAMGLVNDHLTGCFVCPEAAAERSELQRPGQAGA